MGEPWTWDEAAVREGVGRIRAGRSLAPASWPGGMRAAVALSFDSDHETIWLREGTVHPGKLSQGEYGARAAVPRILALLRRHEIPASFYVPAVCALLRPAEIRAYTDGGHEVALHGWIHERKTSLPPAAERDLTLRAADALTRGRCRARRNPDAIVGFQPRDAADHHRTRAAVRLVADGRR